MKTRPVGAELFHADERTYKHEEVSSYEGWKVSRSIRLWPIQDGRQPQC